ncbi:DUF4361 domain-containing protein [Bacteroides faecis]|nr:DUF4361 domain-containing protein [Bacteroides faecis]
MYDRQVAELQQGGDTLFVVASLSGSQASDESFAVALQNSDTLLRAYNKSNFDINKARFAKYLPEECYEFPTMEMTIPAGSSKAMFPVYLKNLDKISPDSIYFLEYKIDSLKTPDCNPKKRHVLLRIHKENYYASTQTATYYNYTSSTIIIPNTDGTSEVRRPTNSNRVFPISENSVRLMAGDESFSDYTTALDIINKGSIILEMGEQLPENPLAKELTILPYKDIDVMQLTPIGEYDNTYLLNVIRTPDGRATYYKEFRLHYKYRLQSTDRYREVNAKLRYQFNPRVENL